MNTLCGSPLRLILCVMTRQTKINGLFWVAASPGEVLRRPQHADRCTAVVYTVQA